MRGPAATGAIAPTPCRRRTPAARGLLLAATLLLMVIAAGCAHRERKAAPREFPEIEDVRLLPQNFTGYAAAAAGTLPLAPPCQQILLQAFRANYFRPWSSAPPAFDLKEAKEGMRAVSGARWYGENRRRVDPRFLRGLLQSCALESFPSRNDAAIAVAPAHLRGLPTTLPLFKKLEDFPFDQLEYPQLKLNEPLRVLHATGDGVWLFVESPYSSGWVEARAVALAGPEVRDLWMKQDLLVLVRDFQTVSDGRGVGYRAKIGTLLPVAGVREGEWEVTVASADDSRRAVTRVSVLPHAAALPFPLPLTADTIPLVGNQLVGEPYGWGEMYGLRDCSAMLRDFFLPFGIWLPRTSRDQIESLPRTELAGLTPQEKEKLLKERGIPFLTLLFKPGHIMLYVGCDGAGRPLVFHSAWSIQVKEGSTSRVQYLGKAVVTTLQPGRELGLVRGSSLLEKITAFGTIADRCHSGN